MAKTKNKTLRFELQTRNEKTIFYVKIPKEIEDFFANASTGTDTSSYWTDKDNNGQNFYRISDDMRAKLQNLNLNSNGFINEYGNGLLASNNDNKINIAPLRTIGASKGVWLHCTNINDRNIDFDYYLRELGLFSKELFENLIANRKVKAEIVFEL
jgi:hypothetical protein